MEDAALTYRTLVLDGYRVIRRTDRAPDIPILLAAYDETVQSMDVEHPDGVRAPTAFLRSEMAIARHTKLGWTEVTDLWTGERSVQPTAAVAPSRSSAKAPTKKTTGRRRAVRRNATA